MSEGWRHVKTRYVFFSFRYVNVNLKINLSSEKFESGFKLKLIGHRNRPRSTCYAPMGVPINCTTNHVSNYVRRKLSETPGDVWNTFLRNPTIIRQCGDTKRLFPCRWIPILELQTVIDELEDVSVGKYVKIIQKLPPSRDFKLTKLKGILFYVR